MQYPAPLTGLNLNKLGLRALFLKVNRDLRGYERIGRIDRFFVCDDDDDDDDDSLLRVYVTRTLKQLWATIFDDDDDSLLRVYVTRTLKQLWATLMMMMMMMIVYYVCPLRER